MTSSLSTIQEDLAAVTECLTQARARAEEARLEYQSALAEVRRLEKQGQDAFNLLLALTERAAR